MAIQSLEQFQTTFAAKPVKVGLEQFGKAAVFYLKPLISCDRDAFEASVVGVEGKRDLYNLRARLVALCLCDEHGTHLGNAKQIGAQRSDLVDALFNKVRHINGMDADGVEAAGKD